MNPRKTSPFAPATPGLAFRAVTGKIAAAAIVASAASLIGAAPALGADEDPRLEQSREIVRAFGGRLKTELMQAMAAGGPAAAIGVCKDVAPAVASELSRRYGAEVGRTSLKIRNPSNLPADWQSKVLEDFDDRAGSEPAAAFEFFEARPDGRFRYMQAIPTAGLCLACHGHELDDEVEARLAEEYPHDRARGYEAGDVRGAFSVVWPANEEN